MKKNFFIILVALLLLIAFTVSSVVKYTSLLSEKNLYTVAGTQENYGFSVAKFIIQLNELYTLINSDNTIDDVRLKFDILYSRLNVIYVKSEATAPLYKQQGYEETIDSINKKLEDIDGLLSHNHPDYKKISTIIADIKPLTKTVTNLADMAEIAQRNDALKDFRSKRQQFWTLLFITGGLISLLLFVLFIYISKINRLLLSERAAFASKNAFLGMVGHELRTSLQAIVSIIDVVTNNLSGGIKSGQIERLETAVSKMERQLNDLAEFAKIDNGSVEIKNTYNSLQAIVTNAVQDCIAIYEKKDVTVKIKNNNDAVIFTDALRLNQVIENLTSNAIKYTERGEVNVDYFIEKGKVLNIVISDTGKGIPKDKLKFIFKPFTRVVDSKSTVPGFGMGLAIVAGIIRLLKGTIHISSEVNVGTTVTVRIPIKLGDSSLATAEVSASAPGDVFGVLSLLVIDDNEMACSSLSSLLTNAGYIVEATTSPERALEKLLRKPYDVVLSDLQMPGMTGDELYATVSSSQNPNRSTPFIFISAYSDAHSIGQAPLLTKPVRLKDINLKIHEVMSNQGRVKSE